LARGEVIGMTTTEGTPPAQRPMRADARRNYERVIAAAREVLRTQGEAATLDEIARNAGVGIGTLYRHFPTRYDLVAAVYTQDIDAFERAAKQSTADPAWDALANLIALVADFGLTKRVLLADLAIAGDTDSQGLRRCRDTVRESVRTVLSRAQAEGVARNDVQPADLMRLVGGLVMGPAPDQQQLQRLLGVVLDGIRACS
jgi:AcrR family transcriptional regulator